MSLLKRGSPLQSVISPSFTGFHSFLSLAGLSAGRAAKCVFHLSSWAHLIVHYCSSCLFLVCPHLVYQSLVRYKLSPDIRENISARPKEQIGASGACQNWTAPPFIMVPRLPRFGRRAGESSCFYSELPIWWLPHRDIQIGSFIHYWSANCRKGSQPFCDSLALPSVLIKVL